VRLELTKRLSNDAAVTNVQMVLSKEESALSMGQRGNYAAVMDAQIMPRKKDYVKGTEHMSKDEQCQC